MRKDLYILPIILGLHVTFSHAQNLVPNHSFEIYSTCPNHYSYIYYATPWFQPLTYSGNTTNSSSSDLYNSCDSSGLVDVPLNGQGTQLARTGSGYAGIFCAFDTINVREYIEVELSSSLKANKRYCVEFYVSLAEICKQAISNIGAYFSTDSLLDSSLAKAITSVIPQVENPSSNLLSSKINWILVSGSFIAHGGERFLTIGNFHSPINTNPQNVGGGSVNMSYYYIDDVSVVEVPDTITIAGKNIILCEAGDIQLGNSPIAGIKYSWSPGTNLNDSTISQPVASITKTTSFVLTITDTNSISNSCFVKGTDTVTVIISNCNDSLHLTPNIFTPNNDGINDVFSIVNSNIKTLNCKIYNRWGIQVGELQTVNDIWDGRTITGMECVDGIYYYVISATGLDDKKYDIKGFIQLIR